ncbi:zinc knuckle CX2CX4HX4C containing protein [Tanacetum coccineum]
MIREIPIFLNKWSPSVGLLTEELSHVPIWVKFHDVPLVAYTSDGLSLIATKIDNPMMLDSYMKSMYLESWGRAAMQISAYIETGSDDFRVGKVWWAWGCSGLFGSFETDAKKHVSLRRLLLEAQVETHKRQLVVAFVGMS